MHRNELKLRVGVLLIFVGLMWFVWLLDLAVPGRRSAAGIGIVPRTLAGLEGIVVSPFIHRDLDHLVSNSVPILVLGALSRSRRRGVRIRVLVSGLISGLGTWLFGSGNAQHIGASGVLFGLFGYLVFRTAFDRRISSAVVRRDRPEVKHSCRTKVSLAC